MNTVFFFFFVDSGFIDTIHKMKPASIASESHTSVSGMYGSGGVLQKPQMLTKTSSPTQLLSNAFNFHRHRKKTNSIETQSVSLANALTKTINEKDTEIEKLRKELLASRAEIRKLSNR